MVALVFKIVGIGGGIEGLVMESVKTLHEAFDSKVNYVTYGSVPNELFNPRRSQYRADMINLWLYNVFSNRLRSNEYLVAIIDVDAYVPGLNFVFGLATPPLKIASVYVPRLRFMATTEEGKVIERVRKEVMHEVGHLLGLEHCSNASCVMRFSNSIFDTDAKSWKYCIRCAEKLRSLGIKVSKEYVLS